MVTRWAGTWRLHRDGAVIADLVVTEADFPWLRARLEPRPGFDAVRELFVADLVTSEAINDDDSEAAIEAFELGQDRIQDAVTMSYPDGGEVPEFLLHVDGDEAWWRWSDEPFEVDIEHDEFGNAEDSRG